MRRTISLVIAGTMTLAGAAGLIRLLMFASEWKGWMVLAAGMLFSTGAIWLYDDLREPERK